MIKQANYRGKIASRALKRCFECVYFIVVILSRAALIGEFGPISAAFHWSRACDASARAVLAPVLKSDSLRSSAHLRNPVGLAGVQMPVSSQTEHNIPDRTLDQRGNN